MLIWPVTTAVIALLISMEPLPAQSGRMEFIPVSPQPGQSVRLEYAPGEEFASETHLRLRARLRTEQNSTNYTQTPHVTVAELTRTADGRFEGQFALPPDVVYGIFAVENAEATHVDFGGGEPFELLVSDPSGRPLMSALEQRARDAQRRDEERVLHTSREMTIVHPNSLTGWVRRIRAELNFAPPSEAEALREEYRALLAGFSDRISEAGAISAEEMDDLFAGFSTVRDTAAARIWRERLLREHPTSLSAIQQRVFDFQQKHHDDPQGLLDDLEVLYSEGGSGSLQLVGTAYHTAEALQNPVAVLKWIDRWIALQPFMESGLARVMVSYPELRHLGMQRIRNHIERMEQDLDQGRLLEHTIVDHHVRMQPIVAGLRQALGDALLADGNLIAGRDVLWTAADAVWNPGLFRAAADASLALGDTLAAARMLARIAADPLTPAGFADSTLVQLAHSLEADAWRRWIDEARSDMLNRVLAQAMSRPVGDGIRLLDSEGRIREANDVMGSGTLSVIAIWSRFCPISLMQMPRLNALVEEFAARGAGLVTITREEPSASFDRFLADAQLDVVVYHDTYGEAMQGLQAPGTPTYYVLDPQSKIRFRGHSLEEVRRQIAILALVQDSTLGWPQR